MPWTRIFLLMLLAYGAYHHFSNRPIMHGNGVIASAQPQQQPTSQAKLSLNDFTITPLQSFEIEARVLSAEHYSIGRAADLVPVDLALGWGPMSDEAVLSKIDISQGNRFYYWHVDAYPIPREQIESNSANMHMIPATSTIEKTLKSIRAGQLVKLSGYLVEVSTADGWHWRSSLSRTDTGSGACELVYVKSLEVS
jgi:hypothetical protein